MHGASFVSTLVQVFGLPQWILSQRPTIPVLSQDSWAQFNSSLAGRVHLSTAVSGPCAFKASLLQDLSFNQSEAELTPREQCQITAAKGGNNAYYVDARGTADVASAFRFVYQTGVPLILNNLDTEFCSSPLQNSLTILTKSMDSLDYAHSFQPRQCSSVSSTSAISFSPGVPLKEIYSLAEQKGATVVGPSTHTNSDSAAAFFQDTTSILAPALGSAIDNVLELEVVTPDGEVRIANPCLEPDLWFALRGGGVNNYGLVTRVTVRAHPRTPLVVLSASIKPSQANIRLVLSALSKAAADLAKAGWGGFVSASGVVLVNPKFGGDVEKAKHSLSSLTNLLPIMDVDGLVAEEKWTSFESFGSWIESDDYTKVELLIRPLSPDHAVASRLIADTLFEEEHGDEDLVKAILAPSHRVDSWLVSLNLPYGYQHQEGNTGTSFTPALYRSPWMVYFVSALEPRMNKEERLIKYSAVAKATNFLRYITPGSGVYSEQADLSEPNHEGAFWGNNYEPLLEIKRKYDPRNVLNTWQSVGWKGPTAHPKFTCYTPAKLQEVRCDRYCR